MTKSLQDLLAIGIRAEMEAVEAYNKLAENIDSEILKERFETLAKDEQRHKIILEGIFEESFPGNQLNIPKQSGVPKINAKISSENTLVEILSIAMEAEKKAEDYYHDLANEVQENSKKDLLNYLANIESGHYYFLKVELDMANK